MSRLPVRQPDLAELNLVRTENPGEIGVVFLFSPCRPEFGLNLGQSGPRSLHLLLALFDLCLAGYKAVAFTTTGNHQLVRVCNFSP